MALRIAKIRIWLAGAAMFALLSPRAGWSAYGAGDETEELAAVAVAVLPELRAALPAGRAALDPEPFCKPRLIGWECPAAVRQAAEELGFTLNSREFTLICASGPTSCRLLTVRSLVALDGVEVDGRTGKARVGANLWWRTGADAHPVASRRMDLALIRQREGWKVAEPD